MKYISTRGKADPVLFSEAVLGGLPSDGGLYVPEFFPSIDIQSFRAGDSLSEIARKLMAPWFKGDPLSENLDLICKNAFNFPAPLKWLGPDTSLLELFHGPSAAFKDFGARFLCELLVQAKRKLPATVLVATSGDTGGAVAAAFHNKPGFNVVIFFPKGRISPRQEQLLCCWGENVKAVAVHGSFDDCQSLVKQAFSSGLTPSGRTLLSANSINMGRLLPQCVYYASASLIFREQRKSNPGIVIPTGNLGNAVAALWAKKMGFPIREVVLATNANRPIPDYFQSGHWKAHPTLSTLANAMDVGNPSNMERLLHLYPELSVLKQDVQAFSVNDEQIKKTIAQSYHSWNEIICPHTATAFFIRNQLLTKSEWIIAATAHPAKFDSIIEPIIGQKVFLPESISWALSQPVRSFEIGKNLKELSCLFN